MGSLPIPYLGLPLGASFKSKEAWSPVVDRVRRKLAGWKTSYLLKGGRVTLFKAVVASIPVYFMSLFVIPAMVANQIEELQLDFLWKGESNDRGVHLVAWDKVCTLMDKGVLGIKRLHVVNKALLCKWLWRFGSEEDRRWQQVVVSRHGVKEDGDPCLVRGTRGLSPWKGIMRVFLEFKSGLRMKVRNN